MTDTKFSQLPQATVINNSDLIVILQGGALMTAPRSLLGTSSSSGSTASTGNLFAATGTDLSANQTGGSSSPGFANYGETVTRNSATSLTKASTADAVMIQFHKAAEFTVGKSYKLSVDITRTSGTANVYARASQDNSSYPDPNATSRTITTGTAYTSSVTFNPTSGDVGLGLFLTGAGPSTFTFANWSCVQL